MAFLFAALRGLQGRRARIRLGLVARGEPGRAGSYPHPAAADVVRLRKWVLIIVGVVLVTALIPDDPTSPGARHGVWSHRFLGMVRGL
ncbi:hypothetical protein [Pseudomonas tolaasii]|uniref:hypothetical protein n=1 Tax=Pseudomonas tolaasii TaxID=29442 RepID=UPI0027363E5C|nr:hypothetical protein [Pseudomonas tolaasii]WLH51227.1 hypothetical protein PSH62_24625 [Pseudomonas tolaasii]